MGLNAINSVVSNARSGLQKMAQQYSDILKSLNHNVLNVGVGKCLSNSGFDLIIKNSGHYDWLAKFRAGRLINKNKIDVVFCHCSRSVSIFCPFKKKVLVVAVPHTHNLKRFLKADYFIAISGIVQQRLLESGVSQSKIALIYNSVRLNFSNMKNIQNNQIIKFGFLGRLDANKNVEFLLNVIVGMKKKGLEPKFIIGGEGPLENELKEVSKVLKIEDNVSFRGWVDKDDFFKQIDCLLFPSFNEVMPLTIIEAFGIGIPVVSNKYVGFSDPFNSNNLYLLDGLIFSEWVDLCFSIASGSINTEFILSRARDTYLNNFSESRMKDSLPSNLDAWILLKGE